MQTECKVSGKKEEAKLKGTKKTKESCLPSSSNGKAKASQNLEKVVKEHSHQAQ